MDKGNLRAGKAGVWLGAGLLLLLLLLTSCSGSTPDTGPNQLSQIGIASWYGPGFHGKLTADGTVYDQNTLTAAHKTLPLGSRVLVKNLMNGKSVNVLINDRGPFVAGRVIDLSYRAARELDMIAPGTAPVRIDVLDPGGEELASIRDRLDYTIQIGSFATENNALRLKEQLEERYDRELDLSIQSRATSAGTFYRVHLGTFSTRTQAEDYARRFTAREGLTAMVMEK